MSQSARAHQQPRFQSNSDKRKAQIASGDKLASTSHIEGAWLQTNTPSRELLEWAAELKQTYRSDEQRYTDKRQATGYESQGPVAVGFYEVGKSSKPEFAKPMRIFKSLAGAARREVLHATPDDWSPMQMSDPGAYDAHVNRDLFAKASFTLNRDRKAFNATSERTMQCNIYGDGVPGPGSYHFAKSQEGDNARGGVGKAIHSCRNAFNGNHPQRPKYQAAHSPAVGTYQPNHASIEPNMQDSGASMRSTSERWDKLLHKSVGNTVDPGTYEMQNGWGSIAHRMQHLKKRQSALKPGFGSLGPQRALPFEHAARKPGAPDPGTYQTIWLGTPRRSGPGSKGRQQYQQGASAKGGGKSKGGTPRPSSAPAVRV